MPPGSATAVFTETDPAGGCLGAAGSSRGFISSSLVTRLRQVPQKDQACSLDRACGSAETCCAAGKEIEFSSKDASAFCDPAVHFILLLKTNQPPATEALFFLVKRERPGCDRGIWCEVTPWGERGEAGPATGPVGLWLRGQRWPRASHGGSAAGHGCGEGAGPPPVLLGYFWYCCD